MSRQILYYGWCEMSLQQVAFGISTCFSWVLFCKMVSTCLYQLSCVWSWWLFCLRVKKTGTPEANSLAKSKCKFDLVTASWFSPREGPQVASQINSDFTNVVTLRQLQLYSCYLHGFLGKADILLSSILNLIETPMKIKFYVTQNSSWLMKYHSICLS